MVKHCQSIIKMLKMYKNIQFATTDEERDQKIFPFTLRRWNFENLLTLIMKIKTVILSFFSLHSQQKDIKKPFSVLPFYPIVLVYNLMFNILSL